MPSRNRRRVSNLPVSRQVKLVVYQRNLNMALNITAGLVERGKPGFAIATHKKTGVDLEPWEVDLESSLTWGRMENLNDRRNRSPPDHLSGSPPTSITNYSL